MKKDKELEQNLQRKNGLEKLLNIKFGVKYAIDKILSEKNRNIFNNFNDILNKKRLDNLKGCYVKIKNHGFYNKLREVIKIPDSFKRRIFKKVLYNLKDKTGKLANKKSF